VSQGNACQPPFSTFLQPSTLGIPMGQYWQLINIDKREKIPLNGWKWGEFYINFPYEAIQCLAWGNSWSGDRILLLGDCAYCFPPGVLKETELEELNPDKLDFPYITRYEPFKWPRNVALRNLNSREYITDQLFPGMVPLISFLATYLMPDRP
jgi:hypothetical protein